MVLTLRALSSDVSVRLAPPRVEAICWLVMAGEVSMVDNLIRGLTTNSFSYTCVMYGKEESVNHIFLHCEVAVSIWSNVIGKCGIALCCPKSII